MSTLFVASSGLTALVAATAKTLLEYNPGANTPAELVGLTVSSSYLTTATPLALIVELMTYSASRYGYGAHAETCGWSPGHRSRNREDQRHRGTRDPHGHLRLGPRAPRRPARLRLAARTRLLLPGQHVQRDPCHRTGRHAVGSCGCLDRGVTDGASWTRLSDPTVLAAPRTNSRERAERRAPGRRRDRRRSGVQPSQDPALPVDNELYTPSYAAVVGALSLGSRYTLDDTSGTVAAAAVGSAGSYGGTVTLSASRIVKDAGTAVTTDGVTGFIQIPAAAGAVGVGFWFREGTGSAAGIPMCRDNTTAGGTGWYLDTTGTNPVVRAGGTNHTVTTVLSSALHTGDHLVVIQTDGTNVSFIVDNQIVDTWVKVAAFTTNTWFFGRNGGVTAAGNYWNGTWDEIFFPTTLLSATDVTNLWNAGTSATVGGAQALGRVKKLALPIATTTSAAQPLGRVKSRVLPVATETDTANRFGRPLPIARETDAAQALARVKSRSCRSPPRPTRRRPSPAPPPPTPSPSPSKPTRLRRSAGARPAPSPSLPRPMLRRRSAGSGPGPSPRPPNPMPRSRSPAARRGRCLLRPRPTPRSRSGAASS
jgi:hypothetical protein